MPSTYTSLLRLTLPADGELIGTWGQVVNNGITTLEETAIAGTVNIAMPDANRTLTTANGATDEARNMTLKFTGAITAQRDVIVPSVSKIYFVRNNTTGGFGLNIKTAAGAGVVVPNNQAMLLWCDGTSVSTALTTITGAGQLFVADGTVAAPAYSFVSDPDTGIYKATLGELSFTADATKKALMNLNSVQVMASPTNSSPSFLLFAGNNGAGPGYAMDMLGSGVGTDATIVRWLNNAYTIERLSITSSNATVDFNIPGALPMRFFTTNTVRFQIAADGVGTYTGTFNVTGAHATAPNFWVGQTAADAGTFGISAGLGAAMVTWGTSSAGAGSMDLTASGQRQLNISHLGGTVANVWSMSGASAGNRPQLTVQGTDANIGLQIVPKGTGDVAFFYGGGGLMMQLTGGGATWIQISGATGTAPNYPVITSNAAKISMGIATRFAGALTTAGDLAATYSQASAVAYSFVDNTRAANSKVAEHVFTAGGFQARFLNDANNDARSIWVSNGGVSATGIANTLFYTGNNDLTMYLHSAGTSGGLGRVCVGSQVPYTQLEVEGVGQASVAIFDPDLVPATVGGTLFLTDVGAAGGNGGCIMFGAFATSVPGKHFASIRGYITDASGNTAGELRFQTKDSSASTGSTQALRITAAKTLLDSRDLTLTRDPGGTSPTTTTMPVGSIVMGNTAGSINALVTFSAATTNINVQATNSGANQTINFGTWRCCGAVSSSSGNAIYIRTA